MGDVHLKPRGGSTPEHTQHSLADGYPVFLHQVGPMVHQDLNPTQQKTHALPHTTMKRRPHPHQSSIYRAHDTLSHIKPEIAQFSLFTTANNITS